MINDIDAFDRLVQERRGSIVLAMELRLSCTNPSHRGSIFHDNTNNTELKL